jgi:hypothetical protein
MKKINKKYVFIDSKYIRRCTYEVKREFAFNDFDNVYYQTGFETIDNIFELSGIPGEYRKVIIEVEDGHFGKGAEELFTKMPFIISKVGTNESGLFIKGNSEAHDLTDWMDFTSDYKPENYDQVLSFLMQLNNMNLLGNYMNSIFDFFRVNNMVKDNSYSYQYKKEKH